MLMQWPNKVQPNQVYKDSTVSHVDVFTTFVRAAMESEYSGDCSSNSDCAVCSAAEFIFQTRHIDGINLLDLVKQKSEANTDVSTLGTEEKSPAVLAAANRTLYWRSGHYR